MKYDCLIVDDEVMLSENTRDYFNILGVKTAWVADEQSCLEFLREHETDIILLDINLGNTSGFDLCTHLRKTTNVPILFISARKSDDDVLLALNIGGDDYIKKPYSLAILLAKVKAVLSRYKAVTADDGFFADGNLQIDFASKTVSISEKNVELKAMEYKLLLYLVKHKNQVVTKDEIFENVWEDNFSNENTLNVHVRRLREKIEDDPSRPCYIVTARGKGYVFEVSR
jgi:two-component system response regulator RegX3